MLWQQRSPVDQNCDHDIDTMRAKEHANAKWGWNWMEHLKSTQPNHVSHLGPHEASCKALATTATTDDMSVKTVEMDMVGYSGSRRMNMGLMGQEFIDSSPISNRRQPILPSYMASTRSAKAKARSEGPIKSRVSSGPLWNSSTKADSATRLGADSSSSGGGTTVYQFPRSPSPKTNRNSPKPRRSADGSPAFVGVEDWALPLGAHGWA